jgi:Leucine-rich repeat (LRR) protein
MFDWFKKKSSAATFLIGGAEYQQFKDLSKKPSLIDHFASVCAGMSQVPFNVKDDVQRMVGLAQSLISVTGLGVSDLVNCAKTNKWASIEDRLSRASASLGPLMEKARPALERLRAWADANNLPPLAQFDSSAYQMTGFPRELTAIFTLRQLHLPNAGLTSLPAELSALPALESICVDGNKIDSFPSGIFSLLSLRRIDAEGNEIEVIPDSIGEAQHLQSFDLDGNNLRFVSPEIARCNSLKRVYLRKQRHGARLDYRDTPLSDDAMKALASLDARGVDVRF